MLAINSFQSHTDDHDTGQGIDVIMWIKEKQELGRFFSRFYRELVL